MQRLLAYQALWGMENLPDVDLDAGLDRAMDRIAEAGFDGVGFALLRAERAEKAAKAATRLGQSFEITAFVRTGEELATQLRRAEDLGAHHLNVQVLERLDRVADAVALLTEMQASVASARIPVNFETHRGRLTNDLLFTCRVLDEMPNLRVTGDLSHYPLTHEMPLPVPPVDLARITKVLGHCWGFHGRVPGSHQIQVSVEAPQHQGWVEQFKAWWREGFENWRRRAGPDAELSFMSELGPPHYAITDANGVELSDRWREAQILKDMARAIWAETAGAKSPQPAAAT
jgi:hypothetical protein